MNLNQFVSKQKLRPITSPNGTLLPLREATGLLSPDAFLTANAFMHFPDDLVTALIYLQTIKVASELADITDHRERPRSVMKWFYKTKEESINQFNVARLVGSILLAGAEENKPFSLRKSIFIVQKLIDDADQKVVGKLPRDEKNIRNAFNRFKPSIHLILAMESMSEDEWDKASGGEQTLQMAFFSLAAQVQGILLAKSIIADWRPWMVDPTFFNLNAAGTSDRLPANVLRYVEKYSSKPDREEVDRD